MGFFSAMVAHKFVSRRERFINSIMFGLWTLIIGVIAGAILWAFGMPLAGTVLGAIGVTLLAPIIVAKFINKWSWSMAINVSLVAVGISVFISFVIAVFGLDFNTILILLLFSLM